MSETNTPEPITEEEHLRRFMFGRALQDIGFILDRARPVMEDGMDEDFEVGVEISMQTVPSGKLKDTERVGAEYFITGEAVVSVKWPGDDNGWYIGADLEGTLYGRYLAQHFGDLTVDEYAKMTGPMADALASVFDTLGDLKSFLEQGFAGVKD